jgi:hypothetical protein
MIRRTCPAAATGPRRAGLRHARRLHGLSCQFAQAVCAQHDRVGVLTPEKGRQSS